MCAVLLCVCVSGGVHASVGVYVERVCTRVWVCMVGVCVCVCDGGVHAVRCAR